MWLAEDILANHLHDHFRPASDGFGSQCGLEGKTPNNFVLGDEPFLALGMLGAVHLLPRPAQSEGILDGKGAIGLEVALLEHSRDLYEFVLCTLNRWVRELKCLFHLLIDFFSDFILVWLFSSILRGFE